MREVEEFESKYLLESENYNMLEDVKTNDLYPHLDDPDFNIKIRNKKEFYDNGYPDDDMGDYDFREGNICEQEFELAPHQLFVKNFLSAQTPYNGLLLFHGLGTGKTCSAIGVTEEMRDYQKQMGISQKIMIVASPNVQNNFKHQLFDDSKLEKVDGFWKAEGCIGNKLLKEINPVGTLSLSKERIIKEVNKVIGRSYTFMGYIEFANYIKRIGSVKRVTDEGRMKEISRRKLNRHFKDRLVVIDEIHNIRLSDEKKDKKVVKALERLVDEVDNMRLLLLSATPMYNSHKEIVWLFNLLNKNDNRALMDVGDIFDSAGKIKELGRDILIKKVTGYVSYVKGETPYTFPFRLYPGDFAEEDRFFKEDGSDLPIKQINDKDIEEPINTNVVQPYLTRVGGYQEEIYNKYLQELKNGALLKNFTKEFGEMESFGYNILQRLIECLNIVYPYSMRPEEIDIKDYVGSEGLGNIMERTGEKGKQYEYREGVERIFEADKIGNYSGKIASICNSIEDSKGIVLIYSQYIDGGLVPMALALEEMGFKRWGGESLLKREKDNNKKYVVISGNKNCSPNNLLDLKAVTSPENKEGDKVKVVLISLAGAEGLDFKNIRQVHVMEPWYNLNRIEQIIGRGVRTCSHKLLEFEERNVEIYLHGSRLKDVTKEAVDIYVYRVASGKAEIMGNVSRVLKETAVDCQLNEPQRRLDIKDNYKIISSSGKEITDYRIGDKDYSAICDYQRCNYVCKGFEDVPGLDKNRSTYNRSHLLANVDKIEERIRGLMKDKHFYKREALMDAIRVQNSSYKRGQIDMALTKLVEDKSELITDKYGRPGHLINKDDLYLFQPIEISNEELTLFERETPISDKTLSLRARVPRIELKNMKVDIEDEKEEDIFEYHKLKTMKDNLKIAFSAKEQKQSSWYEEFNKIYKNLKASPDVVKRLDIEDYINDEQMRSIIVSRLIEELISDDVIHLLRYLNNKKREDLDEEEGILSDYLQIGNPDIIENDEHRIICLLTKGKEVIYISLETLNDVNRTEIESVRELLVNKNERLKRLTEDDLHMIIGYMSYFKTDTMAFKIKNVSKKRNPGARCDQAKYDVIKSYVNDLVVDEDYNVIEQVGKMGGHQTCVLFELLLRIYDRTGRDGKRWFLTPVEANLANMDKRLK